MKCLKLYSLFCLFVFMASPSFGGQTLPSAKELLTEIEQTSASNVLERLWNDPQLFDQLENKIASGKDEWLKVAVALKPVSDAGFAEALEMSVAAALPKNPHGVLQLVNRGFDLKWVCGEPEFEVPLERSLKHFNRSLSALDKVKDPSLSELKQQCVNHIQSLVKAIKEKRTRGLKNR